MPTQQEYNVSVQQGRKIHARVVLLNFNFQRVDSWENVVVGTPSFSINAESDIRRTCSISLLPKDKSFDIKYGNKIWIDKYVQIYLGIEDVHSKNEVVYTNMGIYMINNPSRVYTPIDNTLTFEGLDLMAKMTGLRNGNLEGMIHRIPQNSNVREAIIALVKLAGFERYIVEECPYSVPNDINISVGGTVYDALLVLKNIVPNYQIYFDIDGIFHYEPTPSGDNEQIRVSDTIWEKTLSSYQVNTDFSNIKNVIEVYGKTHEISNFSTSTTINGNSYVLTIPSVTTLRNNLKVGFVAPSKINNTTIGIILNGSPTKVLRNENGTLPKLENRANVYYVAKYIQSGDYWLFMGEVTPSATAEDINPDSPFYVNGTTGRIRIVLSGGEYDNIYMSTLAKERADWELYSRCKIKDSITLQCVPIYWLDVNWLIEITLPNKQGEEEKNKYIIKQINTTFDISGLQQVTAMRYYPFYSST
jgi:hypothetical protein